MALYVIGDPHLSLGSQKPMDIFSGWEGYVDQLTANWKAKITQNDTVVLAGDISWGMSLEESLCDFQYIHNLPGKKVLVKGNHDYWWSTRSKMEAFFELHGLDSLQILHNNCVIPPGENKIICASRGWMMESGQVFNAKIITREVGRLRASLAAAEGYAGEKIVFLHYPPVYGEQMIPEFVDLLIKHNIKRCYYGHIHGHACRFALNGDYMGIHFSLISGDFIGFDPQIVP